jgi:hypothetical protein
VPSPAIQKKEDTGAKEPIENLLSALGKLNGKPQRLKDIQGDEPGERDVLKVVRETIISIHDQLPKIDSISEPVSRLMFNDIRDMMMGLDERARELKTEIYQKGIFPYKEIISALCKALVHMNTAIRMFSKDEEHDPKKRNDNRSESFLECWEHLGEALQHLAHLDASKDEGSSGVAVGDKRSTTASES